MTFRRVKLVAIGSVPNPISDGFFWGISGGLVFALLRLIIPNSPIFAHLSIILIIPAAVMARYRYGVVPIWITLFPTFILLLGAACPSPAHAYSTTPCPSIGVGKFAVNAWYATLGFVLGRVFAWMRQSAAFSDTYTSLGRIVTPLGLIVLMIALYIPYSGDVIGAYPNSATKQLLYIASSISILTGIACYLWGDSP